MSRSISIRCRRTDCVLLSKANVATSDLNSPNITFRTDGKLAAVGFMTPADVEVYILTLQKAGLRFVEQGKCRDIRSEFSEHHVPHRRQARGRRIHDAGRCRGLYPDAAEGRPAFC